MTVVIVDKVWRLTRRNGPSKPPRNGHVNRVVSDPDDAPAGNISAKWWIKEFRSIVREEIARYFKENPPPH